jgi:hypothetical protein
LKDSITAERGQQNIGQGRISQKFDKRIYFIGGQHYIRQEEGRVYWTRGQHVTMVLLSFHFAKFVGVLDCEISRYFIQISQRAKI